MSSRELEAQKLQREWSESPRWRGVRRGYSAEEVIRLRGSQPVEHSLARRGAEKLWKLLNEEPFVNTLGALTGKGSSLLVMAIVGGAVVPLEMGWVADHHGLQLSFLLPMLCYLYIVFYAWRGSRLSP